MKKCLMLDVDGVLVNSPDSWARDIERDLGIDPGQLQSRFFVPHWSDIVSGRKALDAVLAQCLPQFAPEVTPDDFTAYWFARDSIVDRGVVDACDRLRSQGTRIYLATNQEHLRAAYLMETLHLADHVDGIVYSAAVGAKKPASAFFEAAEAKSGFPRSGHILVDDLPKNVEAARAFGWSAFLWTGSEDLVKLVQSA